jgi:outer membrane protein, heavy metal efflux system
MAMQQTISRSLRSTRFPLTAALPALLPVLLPVLLLGLALGCASATRAIPLPAPIPRSEAREAPDRSPIDSGTAIGADSTLEDLIRRAIEANPALEAARQRWIAALERAPQQASWPDPRLASKVFLEPVETRVGPQRIGLSLSQRLPWPGKRRVAETVAEQLAAAEDARFESRRRALVTEVRELWFQLAFLERAVEIVGRNQELVASSEEIVRTRYGAGEAAWADLVRAQLELARLDDRRRSLADRRRPLRARLNAALHRSSDAELPLPSLPDEPVLPGDADELRRRLEETNPTLLAHRFEIEVGRSGVEAARIAGRPDLTVGLEYLVTGEARMSDVEGSGDDPIAALISLDLPLRRERRAAQEREARARERAAQQEFAGERDRLFAKLEEERWAGREAHRKLALYRRTILPRTEQSLEAVRTAFGTGDASFLDLLDIERTLLEIELELERARADGARAHARIEGLMGEPLDHEPLREESR